MNNPNSLIVSDYDGTIKRNEDLSEMKKSLAILRDVINNQYYFMISTGRLYESMALEISKMNIPFNYLCCANGNILFNNNLVPLWKNSVSNQILTMLKSYYNNILAIDSYDEFGISTSNEIIEYVIYLKEDKKVRREIVNILLSSNMFDYCTDGNSKFIIHIFNSSNKIQTIELVRKKLHIPLVNTFAVGDGPNDMEMIKKYNGFIVGNSLNDNEKYALQKYESFYPFITDAQQGLIKRRKWN